MQISYFDVNCDKHYKITKPIRLIELFAGIGSQAKALKNLGKPFEHYRICEFDKYAVQSYNAVHGTNFKTSDITKIHAADLGITDTDKFCYIMTYSFPCQDLSVAGQQKGMAKGIGTRSGLLWEVERLLKECKELPQVLLMENVPQVLNGDFGGWLDFLDSLGYKNYYKILNAKNFGIPQNRKRCFMVSVLGNYYYDFPKEIPLKLRLKDMLERKVDEKFYLSEKGVKYITSDKRYGSWCKIDQDIAMTVNAVAQTNWTGDFISEPKCEVVATLDIPGRFESACRVHGIDGIAPACNTCGGGGLETKIAEPTILQRPHGFNKGAELEHCPSITTSCWESNNLLKQPITVDTDIKQCVRKNYEREKEQIAQSDKEIYQCECESGFQDNKVGIKVSPTLRAGNSHTAVYNNYRIRKLTPKECWRLMGFTDSDFDNAKASGVSNSQLYKQAGNSIVVPVLEAIFRNLF